MADDHSINDPFANSDTTNDLTNEVTQLDNPLNANLAASQQAARRSRKTKKFMYGLAGIGVLLIAGLFIYQALNTSSCPANTLTTPIFTTAAAFVWEASSKKPQCVLMTKLCS